MRTAQSDRASAILQQIESLSPDEPYSSDRSLLHAYVACLSLPELCDAFLSKLGIVGSVRAAMKSRLLKLATAGCDQAALDYLVGEAIRLASENRKLQPAVDSICSGLFDALPIPTQQRVMEGWLDRGTRGALARWLKCAERRPEFFDEDLIWAMWRAEPDDRLLRSLCLQSNPTTLAKNVLQVVNGSQEGWLIGKAFLRADTVSDDSWDELQQKHPATYLYVCAKTSRLIGEDEAVAMVLALPHNQYPDLRGLGIWALGQLGMLSALNRIHEHLLAT